MTDLVVIVPSRGRPQQARALAQVFQQTCTAGTQLVFAVDEDDPTAADYPEDETWHLPSKSMTEALNIAANVAAINGQAFAVGFMGDDHCPRTYGWDEQYLAALRELGTGIVYGDDLLQGRDLATQCAMTSDVIRELGYMAPPSLTHLYVDNFWMTLGAGADCIRYLPDVVIEHRHPVAGKAAWDANYARVNDRAMYAKDEAAFRDYVQSGLDADVAKVRALRGARV
jgi:hypothetical protein